MWFLKQKNKQYAAYSHFVKPFGSCEFESFPLKHSLSMHSLEEAAYLEWKTSPIKTYICNFVMFWLSEITNVVRKKCISLNHVIENTNGINCGMLGNKQQFGNMNMKHELHGEKSSQLFSVMEMLSSCSFILLGKLLVLSSVQPLLHSVFQHNKQYT